MTENAVKLLEKMRRSKANWKRRDLEALYLGFGFIIKSGKGHDLVTHPDFPQLIQALPHHQHVAIYLVNSAVKLVDILQELKKEKEIANE